MTEDYGDWIASLNRRVDSLEDDKLARETASKVKRDARKFERWIIPVVFTIVNTVIAAATLWVTHR